MQQPGRVAGDEAIGRDGDKRVNGRLEFKARDFNILCGVPQSDRVVIGAGGQPSVRQQAEGLNRIPMPFEASGLRPGGCVPWIPERSATCLREADLNVLS